MDCGLSRCVDVIPRILIQNPGEERIHVREAEPESRLGHANVATPGSYPTGDG